MSLAYLLAGILRLLGKMLGCQKGRRGSRLSWEEEIATVGKQKAHASASKERMLRHPKNVWQQRTFGNRERCLRHLKNSCFRNDSRLIPGVGDRAAGMGSEEHWATKNVTREIASLRSQ